MRALVDVYPGVEREDEMVAAFDFCLHGKGGAAPSIDTALHGLVDAALVDHLHPDSGIAIAAMRWGQPETCVGQHGMPRTPPARPGPSPTSPRTSSVRPPMRSRLHVLRHQKA
jgi:rhamnose utilization protein RhaD (predicted bifunctional aldolase and dehydrogenase)